MSVSESITLPGQPSAGILDIIPLGGDGFTAPKFAYQLRAMELVGDAGGGNVAMTMNMDPEWCSLVGYMTLRINQVAAADADFVFIIGGDGTATVALNGLAVATAAAVNSGTIWKTWRPEPLILPYGGNPVASVRVANVLNDVVQLDALVYVFDPRVRETTPLGPLFWSRGTL